MSEYDIKLNSKEILTTLLSAQKKVLRILHVYEKSLEDEEYDYKAYIYAVIMYISSANELIDYNLTDIIINLNNILINDFNKTQIKKIVFECRNIIKSNLDKIGDIDGKSV